MFRFGNAYLFIIHYFPHFLWMPGTTKITNLVQNTGALAVKLSEEDTGEISAVFSIDDIAGGRHYDGLDQSSWTWQSANTPPKV